MYQRSKAELNIIHFVTYKDILYSCTYDNKCDSVNLYKVPASKFYSPWFNNYI